MNREPDKLLRRVEPHGAPPGLRARALATARTSSRNAERADVWSRLWMNRPLRIAWAASLAAVLTAHAALSVRNSSHATPTTTADGGAFLVTSTVSDDELRMLVDLPNIESDTLPTFETPTLDSHG